MKADNGVQKTLIHTLIRFTHYGSQIM